jgi:hypothetical protein
MMKTTIPKEHQALGRKAKGFDRKKWDESEYLHYVWIVGACTYAGPDKSRLVEEGNYHKFTKGKESPEMLKLLLATGDRELVEACPMFCMVADRALLY